jgi:membrane-associated protein
MEILATINLIELFLHLDKTLETVVSQYHAWVYLILFIVLFCETGLVVTPFLPGDSLLFAAGSLAAMQDSVLEIRFMWPLLFAAVICGDNTNYWIGYLIGPKIFHKENVRILNRKHLEKTHQFYEKHGGKAVVIARFMPIFRTFVPFVAGIGRMNYLRFFTYSVGGTIAWTGSFILGGYFFGNIPVVKSHFTIVIMAIIVISLMPGAIAFIRSRMQSSADAKK